MARLKMSHQNWSDLHDFGRQLFLEGFIGGQGLCCGFFEVNGWRRGARAARGFESRVNDGLATKNCGLATKNGGLAI